jgi:hypothetical protein
MATLNKNTEKTQKYICHYEIFSRILRLKKKKQRNIPLFQCSVCIKREKRTQISWKIISFNSRYVLFPLLSTKKVYHKTLLGNTQYFYVVDSDIERNIMHCYIPKAKLLDECIIMFHYTCIAYIVKFI